MSEIIIYSSFSKIKNCYNFSNKFIYLYKYGIYFIIYTIKADVINDLLLYL